jgi:DNA modification methylase
LSDIIVWVKSKNAHSMDISKAWSEKTPHTGYRIHINHDPVYIFRKKGERDVPSKEAELNSRIKKEEWNQWASGIWMIDRVWKQEGHPAIFPDELVSRLVRMFSYEGDTVLDPFLGSGTTVKVARDLNRHGIGYEREIQYKPVIMEKLGVAAEAPKAGPMVEFFQRSMADAIVETAVAVSEAAAAPAPEIEEEAPETEFAI